MLKYSYLFNRIWIHLIIFHSRIIVLFYSNFKDYPILLILTFTHFQLLFVFITEK